MTASVSVLPPGLESVKVDVVHHSYIRFCASKRHVDDVTLLCGNFVMQELHVLNLRIGYAVETSCPKDVSITISPFVRLCQPNFAESRHLNRFPGWSIFY